LWLHSLKVAQLLRSAACLHTNQSRSYLNHLVYSCIYISGRTRSVTSLYEAQSPDICPENLTENIRLISDLHSDIRTQDLPHTKQRVCRSVHTVHCTNWNRPCSIMYLPWLINADGLLTAIPRLTRTVLSHTLITNVSPPTKFLWTGNFFFILHNILSHQSWREASKPT